MIANLFEWNWPSVAQECTDVLGPKGYGAVQVAPPEDSIRIGGAPHAWWDVYQPVGYDLNSRMGTEAQFKDMVTACHTAGVKVYSDVVLNHMAGADQSSTDSYGGDTFSTGAQSYSQVPYSSADFHQYPANCPNSGMAINDWNNQTQVQECDLSNLEDLYSESDDVRTKEAAYLNKLIGYGVDGFRVDAAKHINQNDFANIESRLNTTLWGQRPYILQEVFPGSGGNLAPSAFEANGSVIGFDYADTLKSQFQGNIAGLKTFGSSGLEPSAKEGAMVTNHDTERDGSTLSYKNGSQYTLATEFMLARGYGTPSVYSGFAFANRDDSPPADSSGFVTRTDCGSGAWVCTDRVRGIANMVDWHNAAAGQSVANWWDNGNNAIAFSRGSTAWIALNNSGAAVTQTFSTGLAAGTYCDIIHGDISSSGTCGGPTVTVDAAGKATVTVNPGDSVALYARTAPCTTDCPTSPPPSGTVNETFNETKTTVPGQNVYLTGSIPALGNWSTDAAIALSSASYPVWRATVALPANTSFEYKYIVKDAAGTVTWESGANHTARTGSTDGTLNDTWGSTGQVTVTFDETKTTVPGQNVYLTGSIPALANWSTDAAIKLSPTAYPTWTATLNIPANTSFEYKYILKDAAGTVTWESGSNRTFTIPASGPVTLNDTWK
ncbi:carbohydrate-binding module family 20 domain-containing protein [Actinacidiphila acididurans]|uniref:carbohydrate-binding module family 20 domain-containing protein n=1 Tax=Actinacidiphila acididurans TaxID=2784346 RepID=UPI0027DDEFCA|nr:carbohydrate-binding module family 20 domain-containing protein [Actinacidiphila acididurans]